MTRQIQNLLNRNGRYFSRLSVPVQLREIIGKRELLKPLGPDRMDAIRQHYRVIADFQDQLEAARKQLEEGKPEKPVPAGKPLTVRQMARELYREELRQDEIRRYADPAIAGKRDPDLLQGFADAFASSLRKLIAGVISTDERKEGFVGATIGYAIDDFRERGHTTAKAGTPEYEELAKALAAARLEAMERSKERDQGIFNGEPSHPILTDPKPAPGDPLRERIISEDSTKPLNEIVPDFLKSRGISPSMEYEHISSVRMFEEHLGFAKPVYAITRADVRTYMKALQEAPAHALKRFPGKTLPEAIKANQALKQPYDLLTPGTINDKWLARLNTLLSWCQRNDIIPDNPASGVKIDFKATSKPPRIPFDASDLKKIFDGYISGEDRFAAICSLYLGTRPSELAQVRLDSIRYERGILIVAIEEELKNAESNRVVPVHQDLIDLGFEKHVEALRKKGATHLFPKWFKDGTNARLKAEKKCEQTGKPLQLNQHFPKFIPRRFNYTYLANIGITDTRKNFYSFRHTFKTGLAIAGVPKEVRDQLTGHKNSDVGSIYEHGYSVEKLKEGIDQLQFDDLKLKNLCS